MGLSALVRRMGWGVLTAAAIDEHPFVPLRNVVPRERQLEPALVVQRLRACVRPNNSSARASSKYRTDDALTQYS